MTSRPVTELEKTIGTILDMFIEYLDREDDPATLTTGKFKELVTKELPNLMKNVGDLDEKMKSLDVNHDGQLEFGEYWQLIGELAKEMKKEKMGEK